MRSLPLHRLERTCIGKLAAIAIASRFGGEGGGCLVREGGKSWAAVPIAPLVAA